MIHLLLPVQETTDGLWGLIPRAIPWSVFGWDAVKTRSCLILCIHEFWYHQKVSKCDCYDYHQIKIFIAGLTSSHKSHIKIVHYGNWLLWKPPHWAFINHILRMTAFTMHNRNNRHNLYMLYVCRKMIAVHCLFSHKYSDIWGFILWCALILH